jgi:hypothetical protein
MEQSSFEQLPGFSCALGHFSGRKKLAGCYGVKSRPPFHAVEVWVACSGSSDGLRRS